MSRPLLYPNRMVARDGREIPLSGDSNDNQHEHETVMLHKLLKRNERTKNSEQ
jgi:hypothetical protein